MKNILAFALAAIIYSPDICLSKSEEATMAMQWFNTRECTALEIRKYKSISVHQVVSANTINDRMAIKKIMGRIEHIPVEGDMMKSFGPDAESIDLIFHCAGETTQKIEIYQKRFKTPSTGFNSGKSEVESSLYSDIDTLLSPELGKKILKIENTTIKFRDFSLTYLGLINSEKAPVTASWSKYLFLIRDNAGKEQAIDIMSGQTSPQPCNFDIGNEGFTLLTYQTEMGDRLYPDYIQVIKRNR